MRYKIISKKSKRSNSAKSLKAIKAIAMDVDGVLTDGLIHLDQHGGEMKSFNALDGLGIVLAKQSGLKIAFISARKSKVLELRAHELGVDALYQNNLEKLEAFKDFVGQFKLEPHEVCYIGDDLIDIPILKCVGFPVAVYNGVVEVKEISSYVTKNLGGHGAVREVIEKIMKAQGTWETAIQTYV